MTGVRLDKWLWFARFCKTRSLARRLIERGQAAIGGAVVQKPSAVVQPGDRLTVILGRVKRTVVVTAVGERRGPAQEARLLFAEPAAPERLSAADAALPLNLCLRPKNGVDASAPNRIRKRPSSHRARVVRAHTGPSGG